MSEPLGAPEALVKTNVPGSRPVIDEVFNKTAQVRDGAPLGMQIGRRRKASLTSSEAASQSKLDFVPA